MYDFLLVNRKICHNSDASRDVRLLNLNDLDFNLSVSHKVKCDGAIGLPIYDLLLMFNSNICSNSAPPLVSLDSPYVVSYIDT